MKKHWSYLTEYFVVCGMRARGYWTCLIIYYIWRLCLSENLHNNILLNYLFTHTFLFLKCISYATEKCWQTLTSILAVVRVLTQTSKFHVMILLFVQWVLKCIKLTLLSFISRHTFFLLYIKTELNLSSHAIDINNNLCKSSIY